MADTATPSAPATGKEPLLRVEDLRKYFPIRQGFFGRSVTHVRGRGRRDLRCLSGGNDGGRRGVPAVAKPRRGGV